MKSQEEREKNYPKVLCIDFEDYVKGIIGDKNRQKSRGSKIGNKHMGSFILLKRKKEKLKFLDTIPNERGPICPLQNYCIIVFFLHN